MLNTTTLPETPEELKDFVIDLDTRYRARIEFLRSGFASSKSSYSGARVKSGPRSRKGANWSFSMKPKL